MDLRILRYTAKHYETCLPQLVRRAAEREGTRFHAEVGEGIWPQERERTSRAKLEVKGRAAREREAARRERRGAAPLGKSVVVGALVHISAWLTPIHATRERETRLSNGRRSEASTRARAADVRAFRVHSTKYRHLNFQYCARVYREKGISGKRTFEVICFFFFCLVDFLWC